jgi:hypothetical protein
MAINFYGLWFGGLQKDVTTKSYIQHKVCMSHMFHMVVTLFRLSPQDTLFVWSRTFNHNSSLYTLSQFVEHYKPTSVLIALGCTEDAFLKPNIPFLTQLLVALYSQATVGALVIVR